jgi:hypothetical protein
VKRSRPFGSAAAGSLAAVGALLLLAACSEAKGLLERLGLPESATDVSPIDVDGPDGNMPEIASRSFHVRSDAATLSRFYLERCRQEGLSEADQKSVQLEATTLCESSRPGQAQTVLLFTDCSGETCRVMLTVRWHRI